ncbi:MFS transporter [Halioglobus maricola]|uniref:MFS transporter n=1 Tax=Halioglobus maricola TaxID=2601894 RepID=A0A5P9NM63_9GAMM|nr:MFS transporter [Halioglobus maricola]QFU76867.1 MFS transporter [Halioglobus maricola]
MSFANRHWMALVALIIAGEAVFSLPFHVVRFFRPTVLDVFGITNLEIGQAQGTYGVIAMACYFLGGPLADRFEAKYLLLTSLLATAAGGLYFAQLPGIEGLRILYAFWGCSTILLFWSALIKATREWGGLSQQGRAFGLLEAGRGAFAAVLVSIAVWILSFFLPANLDNLEASQQRAALQWIIYLYTAATLFAALLVALFIPIHGTATITTRAASESSAILRLKTVIAAPQVWPQLVIVVSAYVAYKGIDNYVLYAVKGYQLSEVEGARVAALSGWLRPISAIAAGFLADRIRPSRLVLGSFLLLIAGYGLFAILTPSPGMYWILISNVVVTSAAVYALHAVYFALVAESRIPLGVTGTAVGIISVVGFTPDIFFAPAMGWLLDNHSAVQGHQLVFTGLLAFACLGCFSTLLFIKKVP